jgi:hypothetical protein
VTYVNLVNFERINSFSLRMNVMSLEAPPFPVLSPTYSSSTNIARFFLFDFLLLPVIL